MDLGECPRVHDLALRADYQLAAKDKDYFYDVDVSAGTTRKQTMQNTVAIRKQDTQNTGHIWKSDILLSGFQIAFKNY